MNQKVSETSKASSGDRSAGVRDFRHNSEVENFYRFVHENGLRAEARMIINKVLDRMGYKRKPAAAKKGRKGRKPKANVQEILH